VENEPEINTLNLSRINNLNLNQELNEINSNLQILINSVDTTNKWCQLVSKMFLVSSLKQQKFNEDLGSYIKSILEIQKLQIQNQSNLIEKIPGNKAKASENFNNA
jgi:hypothetical protein